MMSVFTTSRSFKMFWYFCIVRFVVLGFILGVSMYLNGRWRSFDVGIRVML